MVFAEDRDSNVFEQINTDSTLTRVAVDSNWNVWVVNSSGKALRYNGDGSWTQLDLGVGSANRKAVDVDTGTQDRSVWFVMDYVADTDSTVFLAIRHWRSR